MVSKLIKKIFGGERVKKPAADPFIRRLRSSVIGEGMLHEGNIYLMDMAIREMPNDGKVLEIGSYGGLSANLLLHLLKKYNRSEKLFCCDPWVYEGYEDAKGVVSEMMDGREDVTRREYMAYIKQAFINSLRLLSKENLPHAFKLTSDDFFAKYAQGMEVTDIFDRQVKLSGDISFAYIDGNHAYDYAKRDFGNVDKYLMKGGFILFDDSMDNSGFGSSRLMPEIKRTGNYKLVDRNPNYLFEKVK